MSVQSKIDEIYRLKQVIKAKEEEVAAVRSQVNALETEVISYLQEQGLKGTKSESVSVSISTTVRASFADYEKAIQWIKRHGAWQLFERRISATAYKELREELGKPIPGLQEYEQARLNVRKV